MTKTEYLSLVKRYGIACAELHQILTLDPDSNAVEAETKLQEINSLMKQLAEFFDSHVQKSS